VRRKKLLKADEYIVMSYKKKTNPSRKEKKYFNTSDQINTSTTVDNNQQLPVSPYPIIHVSLDTFISFFSIHSHTILYSEEKTFHSVLADKVNNDRML
jgi:hypothetical protein